jgi:hypothetical protein
MIGADVKTRNTKAGEHLALLNSLARELERAMNAIASNNLRELEDSIAAQQILSGQLSDLAQELSAPAPQDAAPVESIDPTLRAQIGAANAELQKLNLRYSCLIQHSSRSVALMASLLNSFRLQLREASGEGLTQRTLSCQV